MEGDGNGSSLVRAGLGELPVTRSSLFQLLRTPLQSREEWMSQTVVFLTKDYEFFRKHALQHYECSKYFTLREYAVGDEIVEYNSDPNHFFVLLEGEVAVFLKKTLAELDHDKQARRASQLEPDREQDELLLQRAHFLGEVCRFKKIAVLSEGAPFGELGILYNKPRIALIVARTTCRVAVMAREHYINIFCEAENQERKLKREFIFAHFFAKFRDLKYELSEALLYSFKERKYKINEAICHQHDPFAGFFLLKSGELLLSRSNANNANQLISIVSQGHLLCYEEWRASVESGQPARIHFTARVTSAEARVYFLSLEEMRKIYNIDSLVRDVTPNLSYAQCLEPTPNPIPMPPTQIQPEQPSASKRAGDVRKLRELEKNMQDAVLASLLTVDKRKQPSRKSSVKHLPTGRSVGTATDLPRHSSRFGRSDLSKSGLFKKRLKKKESILSSIFAPTLLDDS